jgi:hypothetical protein
MISIWTSEQNIIFESNTWVSFRFNSLYSRIKQDHGRLQNCLPHHANDTARPPLSSTYLRLLTFLHPNLISKNHYLPSSTLFRTFISFWSVHSNIA